jgi:hypothetical protein
VVEKDDTPDNYEASILLVVPRGADADVLDQASNESVRIRESRRYRCAADGIGVKASYKVRATSSLAVGTQVVVTVTADGAVIGEGTGKVGSVIGVDAFIPVDDPSCADN